MVQYSSARYTPVIQHSSQHQQRNSVVKFVKNVMYRQLYISLCSQRKRNTEAAALCYYCVYGRLLLLLLLGYAWSDYVNVKHSRYFCYTHARALTVALFQSK
jgi:hypothetical protein